MSRPRPLGLGAHHSPDSYVRRVPRGRVVGELAPPDPDEPRGPEMVGMNQTRDPRTAENIRRHDEALKPRRWQP